MAYYLKNGYLYYGLLGCEWSKGSDWLVYCKDRDRHELQAVEMDHG